ncbi:MAG TPA: DUF4912 domain-containing protein [Myxococcaceae bacterium]|jgi:hypothetical protein
MDDLKSVTVSYLRDLARKHLGPGYSKLNKTELIAALAHVVPGLKKLAQLAGIAIPKAPAKSPMAAGKAAREARGAEKKPEHKQESQKKAPEKKPEPERKKEPEGKKVSEKKNPEGKKGSQKKEPEAKKAPEKKAAPPPQQKAAPPEPKKTAPPPEPKKATPPPEAKAAQPEPTKAPSPPAPKAATQPEPKAAAQPEPKAAAQPEPKPAPAKERKSPAGRSAPANSEELAQSQRPAQVVNFPPRPRSYRSAEDSWNEDTADTAAERAAAAQPAEPLMEGFFVARVVGERELRRHHLTEAQQAPPRAVTSNATGYEENLGELPVDYASDVAMALARDPYTLFVSWDFTPATRARAMDGLDSPRPVLRVYEGDKLVRTEDFVLEARSFYIQGLPPGRSYRVEAHFVGRDGRSRRIGPSTHPVRLPQAGLSEETGVRFMRMPPPPPPTVRVVAQQPLPPPSEPTPQSTVDEGEFITWDRVPLPSSADMVEVLQSRRERKQQQQAASGVPGAPGPTLPAHLQVTVRPLGSSELAAARGLRLGGSSELSGAAGRERGGSSELSGAAGRGGASEQIFWLPPPSGRGR